MNKPASVDLAPAAFRDFERLEDFLADVDDPLAGFLLPFIMEALAILALQPGIGRPVEGQQRELIIHRGRGGHLARYNYQRAIGHVTALRIRHQRESGYTLEEIQVAGVQVSCGCNEPAAAPSITPCRFRPVARRWPCCPATP